MGAVRQRIFAKSYMGSARYNLPGDHHEKNEGTDYPHPGPGSLEYFLVHAEVPRQSQL
jgi:hypothetical protein